MDLGDLARDLDGSGEDERKLPRADSSDDELKSGRFPPGARCAGRRAADDELDAAVDI